MMLGDFHPKSQTFLVSGKVQTASTSLRPRVKKSDKQVQLLKRGGRSCACLRMKHAATSRDRVHSTLRVNVPGIKRDLR